MNQHAMQLSAWGRHEVSFNAGQFVNSRWNLLKTKHASWIFTADGGLDAFRAHEQSRRARPGIQ